MTRLIMCRIVPIPRDGQTSVFSSPAYHVQHGCGQFSGWVRPAHSEGAGTTGGLARNGTMGRESRPQGGGLKDFNSDFYGIAATVIPVFYLAHAVLRSVTGGLLIWVSNRFMLALGISLCVCACRWWARLPPWRLCTGGVPRGRPPGLGFPWRGRWARSWWRPSWHCGRYAGRHSGRLEPGNLVPSPRSRSSFVCQAAGIPASPDRTPEGTVLRPTAPTPSQVVSSPVGGHQIPSLSDGLPSSSH
jgi:hypothetical protein